MLEVRLPNATPEAFEIILNYIYTDRIDCKQELWTFLKIYYILIIFLFKISHSSVFFSSERILQQKYRNFDN